MEGWIKLHRRLLDWEWWDDPNTTRLFLYLLLTANHKDTKWHGVTVKRGEVCSGYRALAKATGLSVKNVRTSIKRLKSTHELAHQPAHQYSIFKIINWDKYQMTDEIPGTPKGTQTGKQAAHQGHTKGTIQECNNDNNEKNKIPKKNPPKFNPDGKTKYLDYVYLNAKQLEGVVKYYHKHGLTMTDVKEGIRELDTWFSNNQKMRAKRTDDAKALKGWPLDKVLERKKRQLTLNKEMDR